MIQTPGVIAIIYGSQLGVPRQIFTDGRSLPKDAEPWWYGYSVGKWDSRRYAQRWSRRTSAISGWLDVEGSPLTESGKIYEKFRRPDYGHLEIEVTIDDPKAYTKPWTVTVHQRILPDTELIEFVCQENERDDPHLKGK